MFFCSFFFSWWLWKNWALLRSWWLDVVSTSVVFIRACLRLSHSIHSCVWDVVKLVKFFSMWRRNALNWCNVSVVLVFGCECAFEFSFYRDENLLENGEIRVRLAGNASFAGGKQSLVVVVVCVEKKNWRFRIANNIERIVKIRGKLSQTNVNNKLQWNNSENPVNRVINYRLCRRYITSIRVAKQRKFIVKFWNFMCIEKVNWKLFYKNSLSVCDFFLKKEKKKRMVTRELEWFRGRRDEGEWDKQWWLVNWFIYC